MKSIYWILVLSLAAAFGFAGFSKLNQSVAMINMFMRFGYPMWFMYVIGAAEFIGALGLVFGRIFNARLPRLAAQGLSIIMIGAIVSHLFYDPLSTMIPAAILLVLLCSFMYMDKKTRSIPQGV